MSTFSVAPMPTGLGWRSLEAAAYIQDIVRLRKNLQLTAGFRFESTNGWNEAHGRASNYAFDANGVIQTSPFTGDSALTKNRARFLPEPRISLAWDPSGKSKTVIRAGFGIYRALLDNLDYRLDQTAPYNTTLVLKNVPLNGLAANPGAPGGKISPSGIQPDPYTPTVISWSFRLEQQIASATSLGLGYIGSHGYHELLSVDANEPFPSRQADGAVFYPAGAPLANPALANTTTWLTEGLSSYNALQIDVNRRFSHGVQFRGVYTWSKSLDDGSAQNSSVSANAPGFVMFPFYPKLDWGRSNSDVRHLASLNATYDLPSTRGFARRIANGWTLSGIAAFQSGFPFTPSLGCNPTNNGDTRNPIRPSWNPNFQGPVILGGPNLYYDPRAFVNPTPGTYGNSGRNVLSGPGLANLDLSALKTLIVRERLKLQFRTEGFNVLNRANFGVPNTVVYTAAGTTPSPTAGVITSTATASRQIQFGLKLLW